MPPEVWLFALLFALVMAITLVAREYFALEVCAALLLLVGAVAVAKGLWLVPRRKPPEDTEQQTLPFPQPPLKAYRPPSDDFSR